MTDWYNDLACPSCSGPLRPHNATLTCDRCGSFPVAFGVPILSTGVSVGEREGEPAAAFVSAMSDFLEVIGDAKTQVRECFRLKSNFTDPLLQTESDQFLTRLQNSGISIPSPYPAASEPPKEHSSVGANTGIKLSWLVLPDRLLTGASRSISIIISNGTAETLSSETTPFRILCV